MPNQISRRDFLYVTAGASGLQFVGDAVTGYWQFNWQTKKTYANTCRAMVVEFDDGQRSPAVGWFRFH